MKNKGFTLIELLTVTVIIVILSGIIIVGMNSWKKQGNEGALVAFEQSLKVKLGESLLSNYNFNEGEGVYSYDSGRFGNTATIENAVMWTDEECASNKCLSFDGVSNFINSTDLNERRFKTFCIWLKTEQENISIITKRNLGTVNNGDFDFYLINKKPAIKLYSDASSYDTLIASALNPKEVEVNDNEWHYVCGTNKENKLRIYIDGEMRGEVSSIASSFGGNNHEINIGRGYNSGWQYGNLLVDNFSIFTNSINF